LQVFVYKLKNRDLEEELEIKNQRNTTLENILKRHNIKAPEEKLKDKKNHRLIDKVYVPYQMEKLETVDNITTPITLLSSEEKIKELMLIIKEKEVRKSLYFIILERSSCF